MKKFLEEYLDKSLVWIYDFEYVETYDVIFYIACANKFGGPALELGSGTGRVTIPLANSGVQVFGIEISSSMIDLCSEKIKNSPAAKDSIYILAGDMSDFDLGRTFNLIIIPNNALLLLDREKQKSCIECCHRHLNKNGALVIDVFNPLGPSRSFDKSYAAREDKLILSKEEKLVNIRPHPVTSEPVRRYLSQRCDYSNRILYMNNRYEVETDEGIVQYNFTEKLAFASTLEMEYMLDAAGFEIFNLFGWYDGREFSKSSEVTLFVACPKK